ncbi:hypothetical protein DFS34DRAFT_660460 [Phlyctochytrium arcticum]|nr:hypothetical protein DFS34DRAFT_660460 [Phlyctochytrium arcticum]
MLGGEGCAEPTRKSARKPTSNTLNFPNRTPKLRSDVRKSKAGKRAAVARQKRWGKLPMEVFEDQALLNSTEVNEASPLMDTAITQEDLFLVDTAPDDIQESPESIAGSSSMSIVLASISQLLSSIPLLSASSFIESIYGIELKFDPDFRSRSLPEMGRTRTCELQLILRKILTDILSIFVATKDWVYALKMTLNDKRFAEAFGALGVQGFVFAEKQMRSNLTTLHEESENPQQQENLRILQEKMKHKETKVQELQAAHEQSICETSTLQAMLRHKAEELMALEKKYELLQASIDDRSLQSNKLTPGRAAEAKAKYHEELRRKEKASDQNQVGVDAAIKKAIEDFISLSGVGPFAEMQPKGGIEQSNLTTAVVAAALNAGVNQYQLICLFQTIGVTQHPAESTYFLLQGNERAHSIIQKACDESVTVAARNVINYCKYKRLPAYVSAAADGAWSHRRNAPEQHLEIIAGDKSYPPELYKCAPIISYSITLKERSRTLKDGTTITIRAGNFAESSKHMEHQNLTVALCILNQPFIEAGMKLQLTIDGDLQSNQLLMRERLVEKHYVDLPHWSKYMGGKAMRASSYDRLCPWSDASQGRGQQGAPTDWETVAQNQLVSTFVSHLQDEICWSAETNAEIDVGHPNSIGKPEAIINKFTSMVKDLYKVLPGQCLVTEDRTTPNEALKCRAAFGLPEPWPSDIAWIKQFEEQHGKRLTNNQNAIEERNKGRADLYAKRKADSRLFDMIETSAFIPYGSSPPASAAALELYIPSWAPFITDFNNENLCTGCSLMPPRQDDEMYGLCSLCYLAVMLDCIDVKSMSGSRNLRSIETLRVKVGKLAMLLDADQEYALLCHTLRIVFQHEEFRDIQADAIQCILRNQDTVAIMRMSEGKTILHALPAALSFATEGFVFTVVVYPLLSLIDNQMRELTKANIPAAVLTGHTTFDQKVAIHADIGNRLLRYILTTPEQLLTTSFRKTMQHVLRSKYNRIRLVVDEAYVALEWKSFRDYSGMRAVKLQFDCSLLLLSATLTKRNAYELSQVFGVENPQVLMSKNLETPNIEYTMTKKGRNSYPHVIDSHITAWQWINESGIVYCSTKLETDAVAEVLDKILLPENEDGVQKRKYKVAKYHADMPLEDRVANQLAWEKREVLIMVATSAFALGINCANVRFVIHTKMPTSMGTFLQESGRAGRDGAFAKSLVILSVGIQKKKADAIVSSTLIDYPDEVLSEEEQQDLRIRQKAVKEVEVYFADQTVCHRSYHRYFFHARNQEPLHPRRCLSQEYILQYPNAYPCGICQKGEPFDHLEDISVERNILAILKITAYLCQALPAVEVTPIVVRDIYTNSTAMHKIATESPELQTILQSVGSANTTQSITNLVLKRMAWIGLLIEDVSFRSGHRLVSIRPGSNVDYANIARMYKPKPKSKSNVDNAIIAGTYKPNPKSKRKAGE